MEYDGISDVVGSVVVVDAVGIDVTGKWQMIEDFLTAVILFPEFITQVEFSTNDWQLDELSEFISSETIFLPCGTYNFNE